MKKFLVAGIVVAAFCAAPAIAADMPVRAPAYKAAPPAAYNWAGSYWGLGVGGERFDPDGTISGSTEFLGAFSQRLNGKGSTAFGEIFAGYNWVYPNNWLTGVELLGKFGSAKLTSHNAITIVAPGGGGVGNIQNTTVSEKFTWSVVPSARLGIITTPTTLFYGRAGWAFTGAKATIFDNGLNQFTDQGAGVGASKSKVINGPQLGIGTEFAMMNNMRLGLEVDYTWYNRLSVTGVDPNNTASVATLSSKPHELSGQVRLIWAH
jgi:opacity protein-like surface antigen